MQLQPKLVLRVALLALLPMFVVPFAHAQIVHEVKATLSHPFTIVNTTLPPGKYVFRMLPKSNMMVMTATNENKDTRIEFLVRQSVDDHVPHHTELVFNRYGNHYFLTKIYEAGDTRGAAVAEPSREELRLQKSGQHPEEHTESQP